MVSRGQRVGMKPPSRSRVASGSLWVSFQVRWKPPKGPTQETQEWIQTSERHACCRGPGQKCAVSPELPPVRVPNPISTLAS